MPVGLIALQVRPAGTVSAKDTVPVKLLTGVTVMVEVDDTPTKAAVGEVAATVKSVIVNVALAVCTMVPLVPVIVRV
jgi:hypothetical protein